MSWRDAWIAAGASAVLWWLFAAIAAILLASSLLPAVRGNGRPELRRQAFALVGLLCVWTIPVLSVVLTREEAPGLGALYHKHDIGGLFMNFWPTWYEHRIEAKTSASEEWGDIPVDRFFARGMFGGLNRFEQYLWYALRDGERDREIRSLLIAWLAEQISGRPAEFPKICGLRLVRRAFTPLGETGMRVAYLAEKPPLDWRDPTVVAETRLSKGCSEP